MTPISPAMNEVPNEAMNEVPSEATRLTPGPTPLAGMVASHTLVRFAGVDTPASFSSAEEELAALRTTAGIYDAGWRTRFRITGSDRVRWLNGMVTNTVKGLQTGQLNYTFLLNAQGRIQGDGEVYSLPEALLLATDRAQAPRVQQQLDRFIIMDDVELTPESDISAIGVAGPHASALLARAGALGEALAPGQFVEWENEWGNILVAQERAHQYTIWVAATEAIAWWERLRAAGAVPCGMEAVESLRVLSGVPRFGADIHEKSLAQETGQMRALNFNKGCYLGQEIVERIRSRATVHRGLRAFSLQGEPPTPGTPLFAEGKPDTAVGELTSITTVTPPELAGTYALGTVRTEAAEAPLFYNGGVATALPCAPFQTT